MAQDPLTHFATFACNCSTWLLSVGRISPSGAPLEGAAQITLQCGNCSTNFSMSVTLDLRPPREGAQERPRPGLEALHEGGAPRAGGRGRRPGRHGVVSPKASRYRDAEVSRATCFAVKR